nr:uncharacterized protein LOC117439355 [Pseudochaenichthys georgianus]
MRDRLEKMSQLAQSHMAVAQQQQKSWYDRSARQRSFNPGQKVLVLLPSDNSKLLAKWQGPFEIKKQLGPTTYEVSTPGKPRSSRVLHINLLKEWVPRPEQEARVMLIRDVQEEEEVEEQYLSPGGATVSHDLSHLSEDKQLQVRSSAESASGRGVGQGAAAGPAGAGGGRGGALFLKELLYQQLEEKWSSTQTWAAITIQRNIRGFICRRNFRFFRQKAIVIQSHIRGHQARKHYKRLRQCFTQFWAVMMITRDTIKRRHWRKFSPDR